MALKEDGYKNWAEDECPNCWGCGGKFDKRVASMERRECPHCGLAEDECPNCEGKFDKHVASMEYRGCPHCGLGDWVNLDAVAEDLATHFPDADKHALKICVGILAILAVLLWFFSL